MSFCWKGRQIRKSTETTNKRLAEKVYHKVMVEVVEGKWFERPGGENKTFEEMMERYNQEYFSHMPSAEKCRCFLNGLVDFFGDYILIEITPSLIHEFKMMRRAHGVKGATVQRQLDIMRRAFNIAVNKWEWIRENPFARVSSERNFTKRDRWLTLEEEDRLLSVSPPWLRDFIIFAGWTGIRLGNNHYS